jgi:hypothetical protein
MKTRPLTPAELGAAMDRDAATFDHPRRPMLVRPKPKGGGVIFTLMVGILCGMTLAALAFAEPLMTARVAQQVWGE